MTDTGCNSVMNHSKPASSPAELFAAERMLSAEEFLILHHYSAGNAHRSEYPYDFRGRQWVPVRLWMRTAKPQVDYLDGPTNDHISERYEAEEFDGIMEWLSRPLLRVYYEQEARNRERKYGPCSTPPDQPTPIGRLRTALREKAQKESQWHGYTAMRLRMWFRRPTN